MPSVTFTRTYVLEEAYPAVKAQAGKCLAKYLELPGLFAFNDAERCITFKSERLVPVHFSGRPRVMLLFSNPHPLSVHQGMFLSPNARGQANPFWAVMQAAGWLTFTQKPHNPLHQAELCFNTDYQGPFDLAFYTYYAFPSDDPEQIAKIFGKPYFNRVIAPEALAEFRAVVAALGTTAVVAFNLEVFNLVAQHPVQGALAKLLAGELVHSTVSAVSAVAGEIPIYYTFPTGWRYHRDHRRLRIANLVGIRRAILDQG